ncbi:hypothetical protein GCM10010517_44970 [Streptosporangium fragile]|uniref:Uncharacterized protein n=1 Tax=Streptosporangium fragile TaxID=46186 RepID=A0ABP6IIF9_9ACTN
MAAADGLPGGEGLANGFGTGGAQVIGEQSGQIKEHVRVRCGRVALFVGVGRRRVERVGQVAGAGGVQDAPDGLGGDLVPTRQALTAAP